MELKKWQKRQIERSYNYWKDREDEALKHYLKDEKAYDKRLLEIYTNMLDACENEINAFYGKYARTEKITLAEAKRRVSKLDMAAYERKAKRYVEDAIKDRAANGGKTNFKGYYFSEKANEEMRLYNATMRINRYEMLKANIGLEMVKGHAEIETFMEGILEQRAQDEFKRMAGVLGESVKNNAKAAHAIVNASFHNATFSDRIWMYQDIMKADLDKLLQQGLIQGKSPKVLARELRKYYIGDEKLKNGKNGAIYNTERLMRTELARVQIEAQRQSLERNGADYYEFIVNSGCCSICEATKGKDVGHGKGIFPLKDMNIGENAPPMHPNCRCSVAPWMDTEQFSAWIDQLAEGKTSASWKEFKKT